MTSLLTKEEQEELLNQKIEMMKKKNAELMRRHQLVEEDKRLAEQQGRSVTIKNPQATYSPMKGEILRAAEEDGKRKTVQNSRNQSTKKYNGPNVKAPTVKPENNDSGPPPDPACTFLADRRREGPLPQRGRGREFSRRHPRNFGGGVDFNDVAKKIHDEKGKQTHQPQIRTKADETLYTTGKERRELQEWRMEREKIDRERLERQKNKEGNWRREWDRDKDELSYTEELDDDDDEPLNSRPPQMTPRPDDRLKANGRVRPQKKKDGRNESDTSAAHQVNSRTAHHSNSNAPQHSTDEATRRSREKPDKLLLTDKSLLRSTDQRPRDEEKRFRQVEEQNDSLIIKVKTQPSDFYRVPSNLGVNYVEPRSPDNASRNRPRNGRRNNRVCSGDGLWSPGEKAVLDLTRGEEQADESVSSRTYKNNVYAGGANSLRNANRGEAHDVEPLGWSDEGSRGSPKKTQPDSKSEKHVGSGRISVHGKKRRNRNRRQRDGTFNQEQQLHADAPTATGSLNVAQNQNKTPPDAECEVKTRETGTRERAVADQADTKPPVSHASAQAPAQSSKSLGDKESEVKNKGGDGDSVGVKPDLLGKSFDLDQDPPDEDQFDDDEWEDIDEEVCIDLIAGGDEEESSYEENPLDISDDTLDQLVRAHILPPRGRKVVDWAAEMESAEGDSVAMVKQTTSELPPRSSAE